jgi:hypothetical protein
LRNGSGVNVTERAKPRKFSAKESVTKETLETLAAAMPRPDA